MNKLMAASVALLFATGVLAQTSASSRGNASASENTSVSASASETQGQSNADGKASQQTGLSTGQKQHSAVAAAAPVAAPRDQASGMATGKRQHSPSVAESTVVTAREAGSGMATGKRQHAPVRVVLSHSLDAAQSKEGDQVVAKTTEEFTSESGVTIPEGSRIVGRVTQAKARAKGQNNPPLHSPSRKLS